MAVAVAVAVVVIDIVAVAAVPGTVPACTEEDTTTGTDRRPELGALGQLKVAAKAIRGTRIQKMMLSRLRKIVG